MGQFIFWGFFIVLGAVCFSLILIQVYVLAHHGSLLVQVEKSTGFMAVWIVLLVVFTVVFGLDVTSLVKHQRAGSIGISSLWIPLSVFYILKYMHYLEIRENGFYYKSMFYRWEKVGSYRFISPNTLQFTVNTVFNHHKQIDFIVDEAQQQQAIYEAVRGRVPVS